MSAGLAELARVFIPAGADDALSTDVGIVVVSVSLILMVVYVLRSFADGRAEADRFVGATAVPFVISGILIMAVRLVAQV